MNNEELKKKIEDILEEYNFETDDGEGWVLDTEEMADALIAAGIGDVSEWKEKVECAKRILQIPTLPNGTTDLSYFEYKGERIQDIARQRDEYRYRAEIAERALREFAVQVGCRRCPYAGRCGISSPSAENDFQECYEAALRIAEKELAERRSRNENTKR